MMSLTFGLFTQVSDSGPQGPLVVDEMREAFALLLTFFQQKILA